MTSTDDHDGAELLAPLAADPPGPSRVDVDLTMRVGARRRRNRRVTTGLAFTAVALLVAGGGSWAMASARPQGQGTPAASHSATPKKSVAARKVSCEVTRLPTDGVEKALVSAADRSGHYLVGRTYPDDSFNRPLTMWKDRELVDTVAMPGADQDFYAINSKGEAVGSGFADEDTELPYAYVNGKISKLKGGDGSALAINDAGRIAGNLGEAGSPAGRAAVWDSATAEPHLLPLPPGATVSAMRAMAEDGTVVGGVGTERGVSTAYLWLPDGTMRKFPLPIVDTGEGPMTATYFLPVSISGDWVTGTARYDTEQMGQWSGYRYRISDGTMEKMKDVQTPSVIAANGWVAAGDNNPVLFTGDAVVKLPRYGKHRDDTYEIEGISDDGRTIAGYLVPGGESIVNQPLVWDCG